jgi:2-dehydro-3-deoxyphosphooctonate aldolase (KDO 8-P synthase)
MESQKQTAMPDVRISHLTMTDAAPVYLLGPCVIENPELVWEVAKKVVAVGKELGIQVVFKASYDKANRTSVKSFRGPGLEEGCRLLGEVSRELGVPVTTDVHSPEEAERAAEHIDLLQIPAFLCRQTDLIVAAAKTGRTVSVKKGQFLAPWDVANIADKLIDSGCENFFFIERGSSFGYNALVADMRSLAWIRQQGYRVVFDATHSVQRPGGQGASTGGDREMAPVLARAAMAAGCDGIFMESHPNPDRALSDGPNQLPLSELPELLRVLHRLHEIVRPS